MPRPTIYIDIDEGTAKRHGSFADRFRLVRTEIKKDKRIVANLKITFTGKVSEQNISVPASVEKLGTGEWVKVTPAQDLAAWRICGGGDARPAGDEPLCVGLRGQSQCAGESEHRAARRKRYSRPKRNEPTAFGGSARVKLRESATGRRFIGSHNPDAC